MSLLSTVTISIVLLFSSVRGEAAGCPRWLLDSINARYLRVHRAKETAFWDLRMGLAGYRDGTFERAEGAYKNFISAPTFLPALRRGLAAPSLDEEIRAGFSGWLRFFETHAIEKNSAKEMQLKLLDLEGQIQAQVQKQSWAYVGADGQPVPATQNELALLVKNDPDERVRRAAFESLRQIENFILDNGLAELVRARNRFARELGYRNYFEYRLRITEGMSVEALFKILDDLELNTRPAAERCVGSVEAEHGASVRKPWNFDYFSTGNLKEKRDPYFQFSQSVTRWAESFANMGVRFRGAKIKLDLLDRKGKYHNGFMHSPVPTRLRRGKFSPAEFGATSNAVYGKAGAGEEGLHTLMHEGGHIAHFANPETSAVAESQEHPPFSMAFAEVQSMFMDSFLLDPEWLATYAQSPAGEKMPESLIVESAVSAHRFLPRMLRSMLVMPYFERALYEMAESELTPDKLRGLARALEEKMLLTQGGSRPVMTFVHLLSGEAAATYHGYVLARLGVFQTRRHFTRKYGSMVDNPAVGRDLAQIYWKPGGSKSFDRFLAEMTGEPFSAQAAIDWVNHPPAAVADAARKGVARARERADGNRSSHAFSLDADIVLLHGDEAIASYKAGADFVPFGREFGEWLDRRFR